jgi:precorrin-6A/cobalt-precorrin-6A reductase
MVNPFFVMKQIWLIGGTSDSALIAAKLADCGQACLVTVTTSNAIALYPESELITVRVGTLSLLAMVELVERYGIEKIIDASHPFAVAVSQNAIALSKQLNLPYLRYERPSFTPKADSQIVILDHFETLINSNYLQQQRVLLTVGYKALPWFRSSHENAVLFARILPAISSLENALAAGFSQKQLIALRPPVNYKLEKALCEQWEISLIVTKASGKAGGEEIKQAVAKALGIRLIIIDRPQLNYPHQTNCIEDCLQWLQIE